MAKNQGTILACDFCRIIGGPVIDDDSSHAHIIDAEWNTAQDVSNYGGLVVGGQNNNNFFSHSHWLVDPDH